MTSLKQVPTPLTRASGLEAGGASGVSQGTPDLALPEAQSAAAELRRLCGELRREQRRKTLPRAIGFASGLLVLAALVTLFVLHARRYGDAHVLGVKPLVALVVAAAVPPMAVWGLFLKRYNAALSETTRAATRAAAAGDAGAALPLLDLAVLLHRADFTEEPGQEATLEAQAEAAVVEALVRVLPRTGPAFADGLTQEHRSFLRERVGYGIGYGVPGVGFGAAKRRPRPTATGASVVASRVSHPAYLSDFVIGALHALGEANDAETVSVAERLAHEHANPNVREAAEAFLNKVAGR